MNEYPELDSLYFTQIKQFEEESVWLVGVENILTYNIVTKELKRVDVPRDKIIAFWNMTPKSGHEYILAASKGFYTLNSKTLSLKELPIEVDSQILRTNLVYTGKNDEEIFIGDDEVVIDGKTVLQTQSLKFGFMDKEGSLWVGSESDGLYQIRRSSFVNLTTPEFPGITNIYSIIEDRDGAIWACGINEGVVRIKGTEQTHWNKSNGSLNSDFCKFVYEDSDGTIYAGFSGSEGFWKFDDQKWIPATELNLLLKRTQTSSEAMHRVGDKLLIGNHNSLVVQEKGITRYFDTSNPQELQGVQAFAEDAQGIIYVGTSANGVTRISGNSYINYSNEDGTLSSNIIRDIFMQSDDTLWVATENLGMNRLIVNDNGDVLSSTSITTNEGLIHNSLHRIIEDPFGYLWISSNGGIMRISKKELNKFADGEVATLLLLSFNENDGMTNREANGGVQSAGILTSDGKLWFPNQRGITIVDPADFVEGQNISTPYPIFESIELEKESIPIARSNAVTLPIGYRDTRVNFTAPNFAYQDRVNFSYKMDGVNSTWQTANQSRQAVFTGIPAGEYTLVTRAEILGGEPEEASISITVPHFFYETRWFLVLLFISLLGLIAGLIKLRVRSLQQSERELQDRVKEQTKELHEAAEQKNRFFTGITHELKTPLSLIVGPLDDMTEQDVDVSQKLFQSRLDLMRRNGHRLQHLVDQILDVSKLNADAIKLSLRPVNLAELTKQIVGQYQSKIEQEQITLSTDFNEVNEQIYIDVEAWERIVINLMNNAITFSPEGGTIALTLRNNNEFVQFQIKDNGEGIPSEYHQKVFEYLYQVDGQKAAEGTGIGLFLVKGLTEEMGGSIELNSEQGKGAEFLISLKKGHSHFSATHNVKHGLLVTDTQKAELSISENDEEVKTVKNISTEQILIVEDNRDFRNYLKSILEDKYEVLTASNGEKALTLLERETPSLIMSDVMMPKMNGLEFVNELRKKSSFKHLPVIFLSAKKMEVDIEKGLSTGADIYLTKPIRSNLLLTQIEAVLRRERILNVETKSAQKQTEPELKTKVKEIVYRQLASKSLTVGMLADSLYISRAKLYYEWKEVSEISINDFIKELRLKEGKALIAERGFTIQEAAQAVGFSNPNYFSTSFKKEFGYSPSEIKK
ncbi:MAG: response regulator [Balneola sp.]